MRTKLRKLNQGFTIVEVLIVLAIAALILTIILIAVPDLQRSAKNSDMLHDAQNVASAVQSYEGNNQGQIPYVVSGTFTAPGTNPANGPVITIGATGATASAHVQTTDQVFVSNGANTVVYKAQGTTVSATAISGGQIVVDTGSDCGTTGNSNATTVDARATAVLYPIEGTSVANSTVGCIQE